MTDHVSAAEQAPAAPEPAEPVEVRGLNGRPPLFQRPRLAWTIAAIAGVLALAGIAGSVWFGMQWADLYAEDRARQQVRQAATEVVTRLTTFEGENIEEWFASVTAQATGDYRQQLVEVFDQDNRDALRDLEVVSVGNVETLFVQDIQGETATAFAVVRQTLANARTTDPVEDQLRIDVTLQRVEGEWFASEFVVLGPAGVLPPTGESGTFPDAGDE